MPFTEKKNGKGNKYSNQLPELGRDLGQILYKFNNFLKILPQFKLETISLVKTLNLRKNFRMKSQ